MDKLSKVFNVTYDELLESVNPVKISESEHNNRELSLSKSERSMVIRARLLDPLQKKAMLEFLGGEV